MRVVLVTGSYPPEPCGVADYVAKLEGELRRRAVDVEVFRPTGWGMEKFCSNYSKLSKKLPAIVHYQYPGFGYGYSVAPQFLSMMRRGILTLHEFSIAHVLRKAADIPLVAASRKVLFTSSFEKESLEAVLPFIRQKSSVIPIGSNIPSCPKPYSERSAAVAYFGLIMPNKGIESFIELVRIGHKKGTISADIIGVVRDTDRAYFAALRSSAEGLPIAWHLGQSQNTVAELIGSAAAVYLPFPEGASERRGSFLACCGGGTPIISTIGLHTSPAFSETFIHADSPESAYRELRSLMDSPAQWNLWSERALRMSESHSWAKIADMHMNIYTEYVSRYS